MLNTVCLIVGTFSLPVCITLAILKYRLYDIDRLISRTLSYAMVTGLLVGVYAGVVLLRHPGAAVPYPGGRGRLHPGGRRAV